MEAGNGADALPVVAGSLNTDVVLMDLIDAGHGRHRGDRRIPRADPGRPCRRPDVLHRGGPLRRRPGRGGDRLSHQGQRTPRMSSTPSARPPSVTHRSTRGWLFGRCSPARPDPGSVFPLPPRPPPSPSRRIDSLSLREQEVLSLVAGGLANKQIARAPGHQRPDAEDPPWRISSAISGWLTAPARSRCGPATADRLKSVPSPGLGRRRARHTGGGRHTGLTLTRREAAR